MNGKIYYLVNSCNLNIILYSAEMVRCKYLWDEDSGQLRSMRFKIRDPHGGQVMKNIF